MGAALGRATDLAGHIQRQTAGKVVISVQTDTVQLVDVYEPLEEVKFRECAYGRLMQQVNV